MTLFRLRPVPVRRAIAAAVGIVLAVPLVSTAAAGAGATTDDDYPKGTTLRPARIDRGDDTRLLHSEGRVIVDGRTRVRVRAGKHLWLLGRSGRAYIVATVDRHYENWRLLRVHRDGEIRLLGAADDVGPEATLSDDGSHVALVRYGRGGTRIKVVSTRSGETLRVRRFAGFPGIEDYGRLRMILSVWNSDSTKTFWWDPHTDRRTRIAGRPAYIADISANRLGLFTVDTAEQTCQRVVKLSAPGVTLWRSCKDRAFAFSPRGRRMVTGHIMTDGPGPSLVQVRDRKGRVQATYRSEWFGFMEWESDRTLLLETGGKEYTAAVRCSTSGCERASRLFENPGRDPYWPPAMNWSFPQ